MARAWQTVRDDAVAAGVIDEQRVSNARKVLDEAVRAYRLAEIRRQHNLTQAELARAMDVSQARVSNIERGHLRNAELGTLESYVAALGGKLRVVADFGDQTITVE